MKNDKEISIDQFTVEERVQVEQQVKMLTEKLTHPASKKEEKEILKEAKQRVMKARISRETVKQMKTKKKRKPTTEKESEIKEFSWVASLHKNPRALK